MTDEEFKAEIAASPMICSRCNRRDCTCWGRDGGRTDGDIGTAPTGKAFIVQLKLAYRDYWPMGTTERKP